MARTYDGPTVKKGKVIQKDESEAEGEAKKTAGSPPDPSTMEEAKKDTGSTPDSGPSKEGADNNKAMFGEMAPRHLTERKSMQDRHHDEMGAMHDRHHAEHRDMMKRHDGDGRKPDEHAMERLQMHSRHHADRHTMQGSHAHEHADMAHRHAEEMRGAGNMSEPPSHSGEKLGKPESAGDKATLKEVGKGGEGPKLGKPEDKGEGGSEP